ATDSGFWMDAFQRQSRLLKTAPYYYMAPIFAGLLLLDFSNHYGSIKDYLLAQQWLVAVGALLIWLNFSAARSLDEKSALFQDETEPV
ncbi:MAG: hypothetical protein AAF357_09305, partial [Verrucomicrobiota bacterium]